jgi:hypothetical protein
MLCDVLSGHNRIVMRFGNSSLGAGQAATSFKEMEMPEKICRNVT